METKEMLRFMKAQGYPLTLLSDQSGVEYRRLYRHTSQGGSLDNDEKLAVWKFCMCQPSLVEELMGRAKGGQQ